MKPTLLLTSAGSLVCDAILRCLGDARAALTVVGVNSVPAPIAFACDRLHRVPPTADAAAYAAALRRILARERPALVLPGRDADVPALAALAASGDFPDTVFPVPPPALAPVFADKRQTHRFARDHGLPFAPTAETPAEADALAREHGFPLLAKPWNGAASRGVVLLGDATALAALAGDAGMADEGMADEGMMVQAFLGKEALAGPLDRFQRVAASGMPWRWGFEDEEATAELTIAADGTVSTLCLDRGTTAPPLRTAVRLLEDEAVATVGLAWARALAARGHRGPVNVQGKRLPDGRFIPYEVGARFGGTSVSRAMLGQNQVLHLIADALGWPRPVLASRPGTVGLALRRVALPRAWRRRFEEEGEWQAPPDGAAGLHGVLPVGKTPAGKMPAGETPPAHGPLGGPGRDRLALALYARQRGLPFVPLAATLEEAEALLGEAAGTALVAKPRWGNGPVRLVEGREAVAAALAAGGTVVQRLLDPAALAAQRTAWAARPGAPWSWAVTDRVETAEAEIGPDGHLSPIRTAVCTQRGGEPVEIRPTNDAGVAAVFRRWAEALGADGHRGPLRLGGKRDGDGAWLPFSVSARPLGLPDDDTEESRLTVPALMEA